ncbi:hypothetical protein NKL07_17235 [Mesorhizobium sp. C280B]
MAKWNEMLRIEELMFQARAWRPVMIWRTQARSNHPVTKAVAAFAANPAWTGQAASLPADPVVAGGGVPRTGGRAPSSGGEAERPFRPLLLLSARRVWHGR